MKSRTCSCAIRTQVAMYFTRSNRPHDTLIQTLTQMFSSCSCFVSASEPKPRSRIARTLLKRKKRYPKTHASNPRPSDPKPKKKPESPNKPQKVSCLRGLRDLLPGRMGLRARERRLGGLHRFHASSELTGFRAWGL